MLGRRVVSSGWDRAVHGWWGHTGEVASKYDRYWAVCLGQIQEALGRAAAVIPAAVATPGLRDLGARQSWYGMAEVRGSELTRSSMAHATSLGRTVAASGICAPWPRKTFRLTVSTAGDAVTITTAGPASRAAGTARHRQPHRAPATTHAGGLPQAPAVPAGPVPAQDMAGQAEPEEFYRLLAGLAGGARRLRDCRAGECPRGGVYFFFEDGEVRSGGSSRVVWVGTHALTAASSATLWDRLRQPRGHLGGRDPGSGNHRASVFRRHVGAALIGRDGQPPGLLASWLDRHGPHPGWARQETALEMAVSRHIGAMPVLWLTVPDPAARADVEQNSIALTSRLAGGQDQPSPGWLGHYAIPGQIRQSGLWNVEHVTQPCRPDFLATLHQLIQ